jgi:elongation factor Ts
MAEVKSDDIKKLREMTGAGMMDCKNALTEHNNDMDKAADALRAKGLAKAAKRSDKETGQGRIVSYIHGEGVIGVLIQLLCETDFVARSPDFEKLARDICMQIAATNPLAIDSTGIDAGTVERETAIFKEQLVQEGKKAEQIDKILPGKLKKFFSEVTLLEQPFIKDPKVSVQDLIKQNIAKFGENITVGKFVRYQIG